ncbi:hypothetical protein LWI29_012737 [Acer saccharum]|uniref:Uncharacterized protein n=1 Tax=Acer saccharum TaxID=4024 RepID=A0AA39W108_ACESA|nr:hypothetical protein LWI29_012737 [Acer saccharum]
MFDFGKVDLESGQISDRDFSRYKRMSNITVCARFQPLSSKEREAITETVLAFMESTLKLSSSSGGHRYDFIEALACAGDFVYCVFIDTETFQCEWHLGVFNIKQQDWRMFWRITPKFCPFRSLSVAFNGDILLQTMCTKRRQLQFWKFDLSEEKFVVVKDEIMKKQVECCEILGDEFGALFTGHFTSGDQRMFCARSPVRGNLVPREHGQALTSPISEVGYEQVWY